MNLLISAPKWPVSATLRLCASLRKIPWHAITSESRSETWTPSGVSTKNRNRRFCVCSSAALKRLKFLETGYNSQIFKKTAEKAPKKEELPKNSPVLSSDSGPIRLIFAGKLSEKKGVKSLLRSLRLLPPDLAKRLTLTLAGGWGNEQEFQEIRQLADQSRGCPCPVDFPGRLSQTELARQMNQSDLFILPSFYEGLPLVLIEALACGLRPICTDLPGIRPWMDENVSGHGILFVKPPVMENEDEPDAASLPAFEAELAAAVAQAAQAAFSLPENLDASLQNLSWDGLCRRLLDDMTEQAV